MNSLRRNPFALKEINNSLLKWIIRRVSRIDLLEQCYDAWLEQKVCAEHQTDRVRLDAFISFCLQRLGVGWNISYEARFSSVPKEGPVVFVANHPLGGLEGLVLTLLIGRVRPDLRVLTNEVLTKISEFSESFIGVDVLQSGRAAHNAKGIREVNRHLAAGGALLVFPAGTVSGIRLPSMQVTDAPWSPMITRMAGRQNAPVMPIYVEGRNTLAFYLSAYIHKRLRTLLLPRAMLQKSGNAIGVRLGELIAPQDLKRLGGNQQATEFARLCCEMLADDNNPQVTANAGLSAKPNEALRKNLSSEEVAGQISHLQSYLLHGQENFEIYCVPYNKLGLVMEQLSIVREITFRAVDEGTGKELDSDRFDPNYQHLFLWDRDKKQIAGGYRLGKTDEISQEFGLDALYSHSLFDYKKSFLKDMGKSLEVGRSFVAADYQKNPAALDLLWKGIGRYVANNPEYHTLFGCVSISRQYSNLAKSMLTQTFLSHYGAETSITSRVRAREPLKFAETPWSAEQLAQLSDIPVINKLVGRIDTGKSIPTLIRHYLSLSGRFVSFTVNSGFNDALDGFILVDLRKTPKRYLKRYLGEEGMHEFIQTHSLEDVQNPAKAAV